MRSPEPAHAGRTATGHAIESYLAEVAALLPGPPRHRAAIIDELRSGLLDATDVHSSAGLAPPAAADTAVSEFGRPAHIAAAFRPEVAANQARRLALALLATGPLIGMLWAAAVRASNIGIRAAPPWDWAGAPSAAPLAFPLIAAAVLVTLWTAMVALAATGRLTRWLPHRPRLASSAAGIAGLGAATADTIILTVLATQIAVAPGKLSPAPVAVAATASLARLILAQRSARRCLAARASLS